MASASSDTSLPDRTVRSHTSRSSISFRRSVRYGLGVLRTSMAYALHHAGLSKSPLFNPGGERLALEHRPHVHAHAHAKD